VSSLQPAVSKSGTQPGATPCTPCWPTRCAMASVRSPTSSGRRSGVTGSIAPQPQWGERDNRWRASAALPAPVWTALSKAKSASHGPWGTWTSCRQ
jgi:hypothetical protein